jgi:hypothetical protein
MTPLTLGDFGEVSDQVDAHLAQEEMKRSRLMDVMSRVGLCTSLPVLFNRSNIPFRQSAFRKHHHPGKRIRSHAQTQRHQEEAAIRVGHCASLRFMRSMLSFFL